MSKKNVVKLTIINNSGYDMTTPSSWFDSGRVADGWSIPTIIAAGKEAIVEMYEKDGSLAGCSGYINYSLNNGTMTIAFSNPVSGHNKLGCGTGGKSTWDSMDSHDYEPFSQSFKINGVLFIANQSCTGGRVNEANVSLVVN